MIRYIYNNTLKKKIIAIQSKKLWQSAVVSRLLWKGGRISAAKIAVPAGTHEGDNTTSRCPIVALATFHWQQSV
ncbi:MAG: hypothetical protein ACI90V_013529 [Bacillariaceae sp.]|jgi:hypothetical protein